MTITPRRNWLQDRFGKKKAEEVITDLQQSVVDADDIGLERKDLTKALPEEEEQPVGEAAPAAVAEAPAEAPVVEAAPEPPPGDPVVEASAKLAEQVMASVPDLSTLTVEKLAAVIAEALQPAPAPEPVAVPAAPVAVPPDDEMQEDKALNPVPAPSLLAQKKALDLIDQMVTDQGQIAKSYTDLTQDMETVKAILPIVQQLRETVEDMQEQMNLRPRSASESDENVVDTKGKSKAAQTAQAIEADINKGLQGDKRNELGVRVNW